MAKKTVAAKWLPCIWAEPLTEATQKMPGICFIRPESAHSFIFSVHPDKERGETQPVLAFRFVIERQPSRWSSGRAVWRLLKRCLMSAICSN